VEAALSGAETPDGSSQRFVAALLRHARNNPDRTPQPGSLGPLNPRS
jgi:hypothetical protein